MSVNLGGTNAFVPKHALDGPKIGSPFKKMGSE